jgi:hypothetical protein
MLNQEFVDKYLNSECLKPVRVLNKYTNEVLYVPCGHCYSCIKNKANRDTSLAINMASHFRYCYFVFLSYTDEFLPYMEMYKSSPIDDIRNIYSFRSVNRNMRIARKYGADRVIDDEEFIVTHSMTPDEYQDIIIKSHGRYDFARRGVVYPDFSQCDNRIPYCNMSDCQLFLKRLRFHISKKYNEKICYYAVSEYGPRTYRPHWHLLLFFNSPQLTETISQYVSSSWSYGDTNCSLSRGGSASYVASYVNSSVCLPSLYVQHKEIRPRSAHSKGFSVNNVFPQQAQIYDVEKIRDILLNGQCISSNGKAVTIFPSRAYKHTVFPRFPDFIRKRAHCSADLFSAAFFAPDRLVRFGYLDITFDPRTSPVSELAHAYTDFFLDRHDKGFVHSDDDLIIIACRLDGPNYKYWHCLTYDQIYSKFYRLFNQVFRCCRFWNLFGFVTSYDRSSIRCLMEESDNYWNEYARRQLYEYYEFLENCNDKQRTFLFSHTVGNEVRNSTKKNKRAYKYDYSLSDMFLSELTAANRAAVRDKVKHKEYNDMSGLLCLT